MSTWQNYALTIIVQTTTISLVALTVALISRRRAVLRHQLGFVGLILILGIPILSLGLPKVTWWRTPSGVRSVVASAASRQAEHHAVIAPMLSDDVFEVVEPIPQGSFVVSAFPPEVPLLGESTEWKQPLQETTTNTRQSSWSLIGTWVCYLWIAGSIAAAVIWIRQIVRMRQMLSLLDLRSKALGFSLDKIDIVSNEVCRAVGLRSLPAIAISSRIPMPFVIGVWNPLIVIPAELLQAESQRRLTEVLIHESAHIVRRDAWVNMVQRMAGVLWWWHPGVLWLNRVVTRSREEICDNYVLAQGDAAHYAQTLLDLAESCTRTERLIPSLGLLESRWSLEARISDFLKPGRRTMTRASRATFATIAVLFSAICLSIGGVGAIEGDKVDKDQSKDRGSKPAASDPETKDHPEENLQKVIVRGRCLDEGSKPLANVRVIILRRSKDYLHQWIAGETQSDAEGNFELRDIETALLGQPDLIAVAALKGYISGVFPLTNPEQGVIVKELELDSNPGTLSGVVSDEKGQPIPGVTVYLPGYGSDPIPGIRSSVTDERGRYAITDLKRWAPESTELGDPKTGLIVQTSGCSFFLKHPDYPMSRAQNSAVPQEVNVTLHPAAIVEGVVRDMVTNQPAIGVTVSAQGVGRHGWYQTTTDEQGRYELKMVRDHYNIWADAEDRISIAIKAINARRGVRSKGADIQLVQGGFVVGTVTGFGGKPISPTKTAPVWVAHYGPGRPRTGAAVSSTLVEADGTYRLRVAPGRNYVYCMSGSGSSTYFDIEDGEEVTFDINLMEKQDYQPESDDEQLGRMIREEAEKEDAEDAARPSNQEIVKPDRPKAAPPSGKATPARKLLDQLAKQNSGRDHFHDPWCKTMKEIVDLGPVAVPDLVAELDATNDNKMLRCLGFMLRAIGDRRAVPALIRAIPKTLLPPGSDMGLRAEDKAVAAFMQKHDLSDHDEGLNYNFGRPVREIFGALKKLTGQSFDEEQLFHIFAGGTAQQEQLKRELFARTTRQWADWWEQHWSEQTKDEAYSRVNLPELSPTAKKAVDTAQWAHLRTNGGGGSNWIVQPYTTANARVVFFDLDTGRAATLPEKWKKDDKIASHFDEIEAWALQQGFDFMGTEYVQPNVDRRYFAIRSLDLQAWELDKKYWKSDFTDVAFETLKAEGRATSDFLLHYDSTRKEYAPGDTATFLFQTREGTPGLLYIGIEVHDDSLKPGGVTKGDNELDPVAFEKGRRFGWTPLQPAAGENR